MISVAASRSRDAVAPDVPALSSRAAAAWRDLTAGAARSWMWTALALQDIKLRYRGSVLGPFWLTISTVVMVAAMGAIYSRLFGMELSTYLPYLTIGLIVWQFVSAVVTEGCGTFLQVESVIQQIPIPFSIHAYRGVCRNLIVLAHSFGMIPVVLLVFPQPLDWHLIESLVGLTLLAVNSF